MSRKLTSFAAVAAAIAFVPGVASATTFTCKCDSSFAPTVSSGALNKEGNNFTCDQTWTDNSTGHDTGGYNNNVKFSFPDAVVKGTSTNVKFAARNLPGECLMVASDEVNQHKEWEGLRCDSDNQNVNNFNFVTIQTGLSKISGALNTTNKMNKFVAFYKDPKADEHHLAAVCAEKK